MASISYEGNTLTLSNFKLEEISYKIANDNEIQSSRLPNLVLYGCTIGGDDTEAIGDFLRSTTTIQSLHLSSCDISDFTFLHSISSITKLEYYSSYNISTRQAQSLRTILQSNTSITTLYLNMVFEPDAAMTIFSALHENTTITALTIAFSTGIGLNGAIEFANVLKSNSSLTKLELKDTQWSDGVVEIARSLNSNYSLTHLELRHVTISVEAARYIAETLSSPNCTLNTLKLSKNSLRLAGAPIISSLSSNSSIEYLQLSSNYIGDEGVAELARLLSINANTSLTYIDLSTYFIYR